MASSKAEDGQKLLAGWLLGVFTIAMTHKRATHNSLPVDVLDVQPNYDAEGNYLCVIDVETPFGKYQVSVRQTDTIQEAP